MARFCKQYREQSRAEFRQRAARAFCQPIPESGSAGSRRPQLQVLIDRAGSAVFAMAARPVARSSREQLHATVAFDTNLTWRSDLAKSAFERMAGNKMPKACLWAFDPVSDITYRGSGCFLPAVMLVCGTPTAVRDCVSTSSAHAETFPAYPDQAVTLRRQRVRDPLVASDDSLKFACRHLRYRSRLR